MFIILPVILGTKILDPINIVVALTLYTLALLVRVVADGLDSVPHDTVAAAEAMGYRGWQRLLLVELPVAVPVIAAGLRVAVVSNVSIVTMAALLGIPQLGSLFTQGFQLRLFVPLVTGVVLCVVLAVVFDGLIIWLQQAPNPLAAKDGHRREHHRLVHRPDELDGLGGIPAQIGYHLLYSAIALLIALAIAVPLGILIGYTGRGEALVAGFANALRALPSLGLLVLLFLIISPVVAGQARLRAAHHHRAGPAGGSADSHRHVCGHPDCRPRRRRRGKGDGLHKAPDPDARSTAVRVAADDLRSQKSTLQIVSTATIAAYLGLQGLGRFILDGRAQANFGEMAGGAILVAILAHRPGVHLRLARPNHRLARPAAHRIEIQLTHRHDRSSNRPPRCQPAPTTHQEKHHEETHDPVGPGRRLRPRAVRMRRWRRRPAVRRGNNKGSSGSEVIVGSADFTESQLVASIYSQALQAAGVPTKEQFNIGSREVYIQALKDGSIDLVPEYYGRIPELPRPEVDRRDARSGDHRTREQAAVRISMLTPSPAEDKDVVAVTQATADKYKLKTVSDLKPVAGELVLGGRRSGRRAPRAWSGSATCTASTSRTSSAWTRAAP